MVNDQQIAHGIEWTCRLISHAILIMPRSINYSQCLHALNVPLGLSEGNCSTPIVYVQAVTLRGSRQAVRTVAI